MVRSTEIAPSRSTHAVCLELARILDFIGSPDVAAKIFNYCWEYSSNLNQMYEEPRTPLHAADTQGASKIIEKLNELGGKNGIGIIDIVENRLIGMKDHGIYETPGGTILYFAHAQLEMLTMDKEVLHAKQKLSVDYADLLYNGKWYSPLQEALTAFANEANKDVTGTVKLKLYKGNIIPAGMTSPCSLYSENLVTFGESDYDQSQATGFINLWGLTTKMQALKDQGKL